ncbi:hypothetical protein D3C85_1189590 [compost metagenome]
MPKASTQLAPNGAINHKAPDTWLSQPVAPIARAAPISDNRLKCREGAAGALDLNGMGTVSRWAICAEDTDRFTCKSTDRYTLLVIVLIEGVA